MRLREVAERQGRIPDPAQLRADLAVAADRARPLTAVKDAAQAAVDAFKASADPTRRRADAATIAALKTLQDALLAAKKAAAGVEAALRRAQAGVAHYDGFVQARADAADALLWFLRAVATDPATLAQADAREADANAATRQTRTARKKAKRAAKAARRHARQATADVDGMTDVDVAIHAFGDAQTRLIGHAVYLYLPIGGTKGHARKVPLLYLAIRHTLANYLASYNKRSVWPLPLPFFSVDQHADLGRRVHVRTQRDLKLEEDARHPPPLSQTENERSPGTRRLGSAARKRKSCASRKTARRERRTKYFESRKARRRRRRSDKRDPTGPVRVPLTPPLTIRQSPF